MLKTSPTLDSTALLTERQQEILRRTLLDRVVRIRDLAAEHRVHEMTIRRDLDLLAEEGQIERIHGGARVRDRTSEELSYAHRAMYHPEEKARIAHSALALIDEGDTVALDASTTCLALARLLPTRNVQVIVTSLDAAVALGSVGIPFILVGGTFNPTARSFVGPFFHEPLSRLHPDKVFISAKGYTPETGFTDPHLPEVEMKTRLLQSGGSVVALLDSSKFGHRAFATIARTSEVDVVVTDNEPPTAIRAAFDDADVRLIVARAS